MPEKLILKSFLSPGDIVTLTAALRDLHKCYPGRFLTDVRTACPDLWAHNPLLTPILDDDTNAQVIDCHYPLIHRSNQSPEHFLNGYIEFLNEKLGLEIKLSEFKGDIRLSDRERRSPSPMMAEVGEELPYWLIVSGGKYDFSIKWWHWRRYQEVVDHFKGRVLFVQVGEEGHYHPPLNGVVDMRGRTSLRDLVQLVYHANGAICPVTFLMHLSAAVEPKPEGPKRRACVVVAGGREPVHWESYPHHQFMHTIGALRCCATGGCWRSRTLPLNDGDPKDEEDQLCVDVVNGLPRCMDMITAEAVIERVELYLKGGATGDGFVSEVWSSLVERRVSKKMSS